jgi:hypothetical protein
MCAKVRDFAVVETTSHPIALMYNEQGDSNTMKTGAFEAALRLARAPLNSV